jgi:SAM-dependent methyltransferase
VSEVFGGGYASAYDDLYADKDYDAECDLIESIVRSHEPSAKRILDLGCGTGAHSLRLAQRGYVVTGVDRSSSMLEQAELKARGLELENRGAITFRHGDLLSLDLREVFDVALMMFAVLGYQHENDDVFGALRSARRHLRRDGLLLFDVWYGPAVLRDRPSQRVKSASTDRGEILRSTAGELDIARHLCTVNYRVWRLEEKQIVERTEEAHTVRYFFPLEIAFYLEQSGFALLRTGAFPEFSNDPDETTWNVLGVARAI